MVERAACRDHMESITDIKKNSTTMHLITNHTQQHSNRTINDTTTPHVKCVCVNTVAPTSQPHDEVEIEAFMYIVFVILFYATSIVFLLIKYARNDDEDKNLKFQYSEFVKRERFQAPQYKNKLALERTKTCLENIKCNGGPVYTSRCPVITITTCSEGSGSSSRDSGLKDNEDTDTDTITNGVDANTTNHNTNTPTRDPGDTSALWEQLPTDSDQGGTSLSYDSGVDYLGGLGLDDLSAYEWIGYKDPIIVNGQFMYIKSNSI